MHGYEINVIGTSGQQALAIGLFGVLSKVLKGLPQSL
jgi:hypothetical protein